MSRLDELARPRKVTKKYEKKERVFKEILRPVMPVHNERLDKLSKLPEFKTTPKWEPVEHEDKFIMRPVMPDNNPVLQNLAVLPAFKIRKKWEPPPEKITNINPKTLKAKATPTIIALSKPAVRRLVDVRRRYGGYYGKKWSDRIRNRINSIWETPYFAKKKVKMDREKERARREKVRADKILQQMKKIEARKYRNKFELPRLPVLAKPKQVFEPPSISRGKRKAVSYFQKRLKILAKPEKRRLYKSSSEDSFIAEKIKGLRRAQLYEPSERIIELSRQVDFKCWKSDSDTYISCFVVKSAALRGVATDRLRELAIPKNDFSDPCRTKSLPWIVSPSAKHAQATPRTAELAQPKSDLSTPQRPLPTPVSKAAKSGSASARTAKLAKAKPDLSMPPRPLPTPVSDAAKNGSASGRTSKLAKAKPDLSATPRPLPVIISNAAKNATASARTKELAKPKIDWSLVYDSCTMDMSCFHTHKCICQEVVEEKKQKPKFCNQVWNPKNGNNGRKNKNNQSNNNNRKKQKNGRRESSSRRLSK